MVDENDVQRTWLPVIGKSLAYLCLQEAHKKEPGKLDSVLKRTKFLQGLGLSQSDAAETAGSSADSVRVMQSRTKRKKAKKNGARKKKSRR